MNPDQTSAPAQYVPVEEPKVKKPSLLRRAGRLLLRLVGLAMIALLAVGSAVIVDGWQAFGMQASGESLERMKESPQYDEGVFVNPQPLWNDIVGSLAGAFDGSPVDVPSAPIPVVPLNRSKFEAAPKSGLRLTWFGHSSVLIEIAGVRILTDPVWGERTSPVDWIGPKRFYEPVIALSELPRIHAVLISHDHYDHLDMPTIKALKDRNTRFVVPLGVDAHLKYWGVPPEKITVVDWWDEVQVKDLKIVVTPARHASGRQVFDQNKTLWAGYALISENATTGKQRVYFSGDTGLFPGLSDIGEKLGPFDIAMFEIGAYNKAWPDWHMGPEQSIRATTMVKGKVFLPIHWGLFDLALHGWTEPIERVLVEAEKQKVRVTHPKPGQSIFPSALPTDERWWPDLPWRSGEENPIRATKNGVPGDLL